MSGFGVLRKI